MPEHGKPKEGSGPIQSLVWYYADYLVISLLLGVSFWIVFFW